MKTFYTERDIADMHVAGVTQIELDDDVVLTDLAREKAITLGVKLNLVEKRSSRPGNLPLPPTIAGPSAPAAPPANEADLVAQVKAAVIARLGTNAHNDLLDQVIPQVVARLKQRS